MRHGNYDRRAPNPDKPLDNVGILQSEKAGMELARTGERYKVISSNLARAVQTAEIIASMLGNQTTVGSSRVINEAGNDFRIVNDLRRVVEAAMTETGTEVADDENLLIVTHQPLVTAAKEIQLPGQFVEPAAYVETATIRLDSWRNASFYHDDAFEQLLASIEATRPV